jgi:hypothetical protein
VTINQAAAELGVSVSPSAAGCATACCPASRGPVGALADPPQRRDPRPIRARHPRRLSLAGRPPPRRSAAPARPFAQRATRRTAPIHVTRGHRKGLAYETSGLTTASREAVTVPMGTTTHADTPSEARCRTVVECDGAFFGGGRLAAAVGSGRRCPGMSPTSTRFTPSRDPARPEPAPEQPTLASALFSSIAFSASSCQVVSRRTACCSLDAEDRRMQDRPRPAALFDGGIGGLEGHAGMRHARTLDERDPVACDHELALGVPLHAFAANRTSTGPSASHRAPGHARSKPPGSWPLSNLRRSAPVHC